MQSLNKSIFMETRQLLQRFLIDMDCDYCKEGKMRPVLQAAAVTYEHKCTNDLCNHTTFYAVQYPYIDERAGEIVKLNNSSQCPQTM